MTTVRVSCDRRTKTGKPATKSPTQLEEEIKVATASGTTAEVSGLSPTLRYKVRQHLPPDYFVESRGEGPERVLFAWRASSVEAILERVLPNRAVIGAVMSRLHEAARKEHERKQQARQQDLAARTRWYTCDGCDTRGTARDILISVFFRGKYCQECIEEDEDMRASKWEAALRYYS